MSAQDGRTAFPSHKRFKANPVRIPKPIAIVLDLEGTLCPTHHYEHVLLPYSRTHLMEYLLRNDEVEYVRKRIEIIKDQYFNFHPEARDKFHSVFTETAYRHYLSQQAPVNDVSSNRHVPPLQHPQNDSTLRQDQNECISIVDDEPSGKAQADSKEDDDGDIEILKISPPTNVIQETTSNVDDDDEDEDIDLNPITEPTKVKGATTDNVSHPLTSKEEKQSDNTVVTPSIADNVNDSKMKIIDIGPVSKVVAVTNPDTLSTSKGTEKDKTVDDDHSAVTAVTNTECESVDNKHSELGDPPPLLDQKPAPKMSENEIQNVNGNGNGNEVQHGNGESDKSMNGAQERGNGKEQEMVEREVMSKMEFYRESEVKFVVQIVNEWLDIDHQIPAMQYLLGLVVDDGFKSGALKSEIFEDGMQSMRRWRERELINIYIYNEGSIAAQKLMMKYSQFGDLTGYITDYFDVDTMGSKKYEDSFEKLYDEIRSEQWSEDDMDEDEDEEVDIVYISSNPKELKKAEKCGFFVLHSVRNGEIGDSDFDQISDFNAIQFYSDFDQMAGYHHGI